MTDARLFASKYSFREKAWELVRTNPAQGVRLPRRKARKPPAAALDRIRKQIEAARSIALPARALAKDCNYALTLWEKLNRFLEYPVLG